MQGRYMAALRMSTNALRALYERSTSALRALRVSTNTLRMLGRLPAVLRMIYEYSTNLYDSLRTSTNVLRVLHECSTSSTNGLRMLYECPTNALWVAGNAFLGADWHFLSRGYASVIYDRQLA